MSEYVWLNELSKQFLERDYLLPGDTVENRIDVIAHTAQSILHKNPDFAKQFIENMKKGWYSLSTPIWTNFGTSRGLPISCFGSHISDTMQSILHTQAEVGMMTKYGGGTSAYFGDLRPRGSVIRDNGTSAGPVHFMQLYDNLINIVSQGKCYIEGTEVLTDSGFKDFRHITKDDKLAELDENNIVYFTKNYELVVEDFDGDLLCFSGKKSKDSVDIKVTPNHRMVVIKRKMQDREKYWPNNTEIVLAKDYRPHRDNRIPLAGWGNGIIALCDLERLRIAFQADGIKDGPNRKIRFHLSKQRKIDRLKELLERNQIPYDTYINVDNTTDISIEYDPNIKYNTFQEWIKLDKVSGGWGKDFIEELSKWDGSVAHGGAIVYHSIVQSNIDIVQAIASLCEMKTRIYTREPYENRQKLYSIIISDKGYRSGEAIKKTYEYYKGKVYCAVVPRGRLIIRYNNRVCVCGNTRRGNFAAYLPIDHPDIDEFLKIRSEGNALQDISFGVCVSDNFMQGMIDGDILKRNTWAKVLTARANTGYPYILFTDTINRNTCNIYIDQNKKINASNLCTEICLPSNEDESFVCDLSSMNILYYDDWKDTNAVELLVYFLDAVMTEFIRKAKNIPFMDRAVRFAERHRALGIGWIGWHSYLQNNMIPFESFNAKMMNSRIARTIQEQAYGASVKLAEEYGIPEALTGYTRRNTTLMAIAPTKSSSFILGQVSEGIEPQRSNYYIRDLEKGKFTVQNPYLKDLLKYKGLDNIVIWDSILKHGGSVQHLDCLDEHEKNVFKTFAEISPKEIIIQAAQRQKYIDQSQSLNLMIHPSIPIKDVNQLMIDAWKLGVKSLYYQISVNAAQEFSRNILHCTSCE